MGNVSSFCRESTVYANNSRLKQAWDFLLALLMLASSVWLKDPQEPHVTSLTDGWGKHISLMLKT